jgi:hypothetical protein
MDMVLSKVILQPVFPAFSGVGGFLFAADTGPRQEGKEKYGKR